VWLFHEKKRGFMVVLSHYTERDGVSRSVLRSLNPISVLKILKLLLMNRS